MPSIFVSGRPVRLLVGRWLRVSWLVLTAGAAILRPLRPDNSPKDRPPETDPVPQINHPGTATNCRSGMNAVNHCFSATGPATRGALASRELVGLDGRGGHPTGSNGRPTYCALTWVRIHQHPLNGSPEIEYDGELIPSWSRLEPGRVG
jgi:hypothetical protein